MAFNSWDSWELENFYNAYRNWLVRKMNAYEYTILFDFLYDIEFEWVIERDENRAKDGIYLRAWFESESGLAIPEGWDSWPCSFLEFVVGLAMTMENRVLYDPCDGADESTWFWELMSNIGLDIYDDKTIMQTGQAAMDDIEHLVYTVMDRQFSYSGKDGLFPLDNPVEDQRDVEFWFQMNAYCNEKKVICD